MKHIGIFFDTRQLWLRDVFEGIAEKAAEADWQLEFFMDSNLVNGSGSYRLDGILCDDVTGYRLTELPDLPRVWLHPNYLPHVVTDHAEAGRLCARHLIERGYRSLGVFQTGDTRHPSPFQHEQGFREVAQQAGCKVETFLQGERTRNRGTWLLEDQMLDLMDFLREQPFPIGIMGCNPDHVKRLYSVCQRNSFRIPEEVAIISPSDEPMIFNHTRPGITAVVRNQRKIGYLAAEALEKLLRGDSIPDQTKVSPLGLTVRDSTGHRVMSDPLCAQVVEYIWDHLEEAPSQADMAKQFHVTPRTLHRHFIRELGRTPTEELLYARIETAKRLLVTTRTSLVDIALECGYSSQSAFNRHFKKETDTSPGAWREMHGIS